MKLSAYQGYLRVVYLSGAIRPHLCEWIVPGTVSYDLAACAKGEEYKYAFKVETRE